MSSAVRKPQKLDESEVRRIVDDEMRQAFGPGGMSKLADMRAEALKYYLAEPRGDEIDGQSKVIVNDTADTVDSLLPALIKVFTSGDEVVRFEPQGQEDEEGAKQATEYVNYIWNRDNPGFMNFHTTFKDALLQKNGIGKIWWDETEKTETENYEGLTDDEMIQILSPKDDVEVEVLEHDQYPDESGEAAPPAPAAPVAAQPPGMPETAMLGQPAGGMMDAGAPTPQNVAPDALGMGVLPPPAPVMLHDMKIRTTRKKGRVRIEPVPPEEFWISRDARTIASARAVGHRKRVTASHLLELGYPRDKIAEVATADAQDFTEEAIERRSYDQDDSSLPVATEPSQREVWLNEIYMRIDVDGDGIAEMRRVVTAGDQSSTVLFENEEWTNLRPFFSMTPLPMPHRFFGQSIADVVKEFQDIDTTLLRQILNSAYLSVNPAKEVVVDQVNLDDLLAVRPGQLYRVKMPGSIREIVTPFVGQQALPLMEYLEGKKENRTGVTRYNQGIDADSLNKTATGISQIMNAAQQKIELIARIFAETGVVDAFRIILQLVKKHQDKPRVIRLRNKWVPMDPRQWNAEMDMSISVGLGTGNRDQMAAQIMNLMAIQEKIVTLQGGASGPLITMENIYKTLEKYVEAVGLKQVDMYATDPADAPPQEPKPDPEMQKMQMEMQIEQQRAQLETQKQAAQLQIEQQKSQQAMALAAQESQQKMQLAQQEAQAQIQIEQMRAAAKIRTDELIAESNAKLKAAEFAARERAGAFEPKPAPQGSA